MLQQDSNFLYSIETVKKTEGHQIEENDIDHLEEKGVERASASRSSFKRTREGHCQSDEHWNCFSGTSGKRLGGAHMGFSERINAFLNQIEEDTELLFF